VVTTHPLVADVYVSYNDLRTETNQRKNTTASIDDEYSSICRATVSHYRHSNTFSILHRCL